MADRGDSPTATGLIPVLDTARSRASSSSPELLSVISSHGDLVTEPLSPLQAYSPTPSGDSASVGEWDFVSKDKFKEASTPSIRSIISSSSDGCEYPEPISPTSIQAATTSAVATDSCKVETPKLSSDYPRRKKRAMPYNNTAIPPSEEITGSTALPCMALLLYIAQFQI